MLWEEQGSSLKVFKGGSVKIGISSEEPPPCLQSPLVLSQHEFGIDPCLHINGIPICPIRDDMQDRNAMLPWKQTCVTSGI